MEFFKRLSCLVDASSSTSGLIDPIVSSLSKVVLQGFAPDRQIAGAHIPLYACPSLGNGTVHTVYRLCLNRHRLGTPPSDVTFRHSLQRCAVIFSPLFCYNT